MQRERRRSRRLRVTRGLVYLETPRPHFAELLDISAEGMRIGTPHALAPHQELEVGVDGPTHPRQRRAATVVHVRGAIVGLRFRGRSAIE